MDADSKNTAVETAEKDDPAEVARQGYEVLMAGEERVVGGSWKNRAQVAAGRFVPDAFKGGDAPENGGARLGRGGLRMKALTFHGNEDVRVDEVPDPEIKDPTVHRS